MMSDSLLPSEQAPEQMPRSFRWRLLPVTFLFIGGCMGVLASAASVCMAAYVNLRYGWIVPHPDTPERNQVAFTLANLSKWQFCFWSGSFALYCAWTWYKGHWRRAWIATLLLWLTAGLIGEFFGPK